MNIRHTAMAICMLGLLSFGIFSAAVAPSALAQSSSSSSSASANGGSTVSISKGASSPSNPQFFIPTQITVKKDAAVTWVNDDSAAHTVTSGDASIGTGDGIFDSSILGPKKEFTHIFEAEGTFPYFCLLHPFMIGTVKVVTASSSEAGTAAQEQQAGNQSEGPDNAGSKSQDGSNNNTGAQTSAEAKTMYKPAYPKMTADSRNSFTVHSEKHLYKPGEEVKVEGSIWSGLLAQIGGGVELVTVQVTDNKGSIISNQNVLLSSQGEYSAVFTLPSDAELGAYTIDSKVQVKADLLGTLGADVDAKLQTTAKFVVVSQKAFAVEAEGKDFDVGIASNSTVSNFQFEQEARKVSFIVEGETGTQGVTQITIQKPMLGGQMTVMIDGEVVTPESNNVVVTSDTNSEITLEINYHHSEHTIEVTGTNVVPEFPVSMAVMAAALGSIVAAVAVASKRKGFMGA
jgi:plastocyanin